MLIQISTDQHIDGREALTHYVRTEVETALAHVEDHLTRVEVHLTDDSAGRATGGDKRCTIEARPSGQPPIAVTEHADHFHAALGGALHKLNRLLASKFGRLTDRDGHATIRRP